MQADRCWFFDNVTLKLSAINYWNDCRSGVTANIKPQISVGNNDGELQVRSWVGGFDLRDSTNALFVCSLDFDVGRLAIQNSNTAGECVFGGDVWKDLIGTGGMTITDRGMGRVLLTEPIEGAYNFEQMVRLISSEAAGKIIQALDGTYRVRDVSDTKDRFTGDDTANGGRDVTIADVT